jgi:integrase
MAPTPPRTPPRRGKRTRGPHLYRRGARWYAYIAKGDARALDTDDESVARERFRTLLAECPPRPPRAATAATLADIEAAYVAAPHGWTRQGGATERLRVSLFVEAMAERGARTPAQITARTLDAWRADRMAVVSRSTIARDEACAKRLLAWAVGQGLAARSPFESRKPISAPARPRRRITHSPAQVGRMVAWALAHSRGGWALTAAVLEATGFRIEEARRLAPSWITVDAVRLEPEAGAAADAWTSKAGRPRLVALSRESLDVVRRFVAWRDTPDAQGLVPALSECWWRKTADRAARECGLPETYRPHDSRRRWVTEMLRAGVPIARVCDLVGHTDVATTERYVVSYYDDAATVTAPTSAAVGVLTVPVADVLALDPRRRRAVPERGR